MCIEVLSQYSLNTYTSPPSAQSTQKVDLDDGSLTSSDDRLNSVVLQYRNNYDVKAHRFLVFHDLIDDKYLFLPASYRGNDVYTRRQLSKFFDLKKALYELNDVSQIDLLPKEGRTNVLFISLEYDANSYDLWDSWNRLSKDLNRFLSAFRKRYGKIDYVLKPESHYSGFPHVHLIVYLYDHEFHTFWNIAEGKKKLLVQETKHNEYNRDPHGWAIEDLWSHGFMRVEGCTNLTSAINYLGNRYFTKTINLPEIMGYRDEKDRRKGVYTLAIGSYLRKRSYSLSRGFQRLVIDYRSRHCKKSIKLNENSPLHNSNSDPDRGASSGSVSSSRIDNPASVACAPSFEFMGIGKFRSPDVAYRRYIMPACQYYDLVNGTSRTNFEPSFDFVFLNDGSHGKNDDSIPFGYEVNMGGVLR